MAGDPFVKLAAGVIEAAFVDLRATVPDEMGVRVQVAAWLVSKAASRWCEMAGLDQEYLLQRGRWAEAAWPIWLEIKAATPQHLEKQGVLPHHIRLIMGHLGPSAIVHVA